MKILELSFRIVAFVFITLHSLAADEGDLDRFIEKIRSEDDGVRLEARREAPRLGAPAIPRLALVIEANRGEGETSKEEGREAAISARHALSAIVHHAGRPEAAAAERRATLSELVRLIEPGRSAYLRREALHLIGLIGGDAEAAAVAALLRDDAHQVAETARLVLERLPGKGAIDALVEAVRDLPAERKPDLIFSLGKKGPEAPVDFLTELATTAEHDGVRLAAFQALSRSGSPAAREPFETALASPEDPLRARLFTEYQRLADNLFERGELEASRDMHLLALRKAPADHQRERSLQRLAKPGDAGAVDTLIVGLGDSSARVRGRAMRILENLGGAAAFESLRAGYEGAGDDARPVMLRALARMDPDAAREVVERAAEGNDLALKIVAEDILGKLGDPAMEAAYLRSAEEGAPAVRSPAIRGYLIVARKRLEDGEKERALEMFSKVLGLAREPGERLEALRGLLAIGGARALELVGGLLSDPALAKEAAEGYVTLAADLGKSGDVDRAAYHLERIVGGAFPVDVIHRAAETLRELGRDPQAAARKEGFVLDWHLVGPFRDEGDGMSRKRFPEERVRLREEERVGPRRYRWKTPRRLSLDGRIDLVPEFRRTQNVIAYAYAEVEMSEARDVLLRIGSDDGVGCWVNGERVHFAPGARSYVRDQDSVKARLREGTNRILLKIGQGGGDWQFSLRITDRDGEPLDLSR